MRLLLATTNANKVREIRPALGGLQLDLLTLADFPPIEEPDESAPTYWENARLKAFGYARATASDTGAASPIIVVAEDSGLEIAGLGGAPGVLSARFLGAGVPYAERFAAIYRQLHPLGPPAWAARFVTALTAVRGETVLFETETAIDGVIAPAPAGDRGFGYDPIFVPEGFQKTFGELSCGIKQQISHRARATAKIIAYLRGFIAA